MYKMDGPLVRYFWDTENILNSTSVTLLQCVFCSIRYLRFSHFSKEKKMQTIHISEMSLPLGIFFRVMQCWKPHSWISFFCFCFFPGFIKYISFLPYFYAYCDPSKILCTNTEFSCLMKELICMPITYIVH